MTRAETLLWRHLKADRLAGRNFRRQTPIGIYIADFVDAGSSSSSMARATTSKSQFATTSDGIAGSRPAACPDLVRVAPQKLVSIADLWLLAHPDLVELPAVRAVLAFVATSAREDRVKLRG